MDKEDVTYRLREERRKELSSCKKLGIATVEGRKNDIAYAYLKPDGRIEFVSKELDCFLLLTPERVFPEHEEAWFIVFNRRGWYAVLKEDGTYDLRFLPR